MNQVYNLRIALVHMKEHIEPRRSPLERKNTIIVEAISRSVPSTDLHNSNHHEVPVITQTHTHIGADIMSMEPT